MKAHETEAAVDANASVHVGGLPFAIGDRVGVLGLEQTEKGKRRHTPEEIQQSQRSPARVCAGSVIRCDRPDDPVGLED